MKTTRKKMMKSGIVVSLSLLDLDDRVMASRSRAIDVPVSPTIFTVEDTNLIAASLQHESKEENEVLDAAAYWSYIAMIVGLIIYFN